MDLITSWRGRPLYLYLIRGLLSPFFYGGLMIARMGGRSPTTQKECGKFEVSRIEGQFGGAKTEL